MFAAYFRKIFLAFARYPLHLDPVSGQGEGMSSEELSTINITDMAAALLVCEQGEASEGHAGSSSAKNENNDITISDSPIQSEVQQEPMDETMDESWIVL